MENVLDGLIGKTVWAYQDDITIFSDTFENHIRDIRQVCKRLQDNKIRLSISKCNFFADRLPLLRHVIADQGIHADSEKIQEIQDWHTPKLKNEVQTFIDVVRYHAQFLPHLASASPPHFRICFPKTNLNGDPCMKKHSNKTNTSPKILPPFAPLTINHPIQSILSPMPPKLKRSMDRTRTLARESTHCCIP